MTSDPVSTTQAALAHALKSAARPVPEARPHAQQEARSAPAQPHAYAPRGSRIDILV